MQCTTFERCVAEAEQRRRVVHLRHEELELLRRLRKVEDVLRLRPTALGENHPERDPLRRVTRTEHSAAPGAR